MSAPITFVAALAGTNTSAKCLSVASDGTAKLVLELSSSELSGAIKMLTLAGKSFTVTVDANE